MFRDGSVLQRRDLAVVKLPWLSWSGVLLLAILLLDFVLLSIWGYGGDWSPLWVAGRLAWRHPSSLYDFAEITRLQLPILGDLGVRPFVYPPTTLILATPLSFLPFWVSLACVSIGGSLSLALVSSRSETDRILLLVSPPILFAAMIGQPTLIVAALTVMGLSQLKSSEARAGFLLGLAAMLKPTLLLMVPFGLVAGKHWRAAATGAATAAALAVASILLVGFSPWLAWIDAVTRFREIFDGAAPLYRNGITPYALALRMGAATGWIAWAMLPIAILVTLTIFVRCEDWRTRMVAVVGSSLLVSPYAMNYELAALAPVVLTMRREKLADLAIPLIWAAALFANASLLGLLAVYSWALVSVFRVTRSAAEDVEPAVEVPAREIRGSIA